MDSRSSEFIVREGGLQFIINLTDYLDTGLFLDHRMTRHMIRQESAGKKVLNLFCYTGSFSVYAAAGGAASIESVDLSNTYLDWCRRNMELNGFSAAAGPSGTFRYQQADVKQYLANQVPDLFDIIIMDPPTFSNSQRMNDVLDIQRDHAELINNSLRWLAPEGVLYFSTNLRTFRMDGSQVAAKNIRDITKATTPFDFEGRLHRFCFRIQRD
jgi:23S rRNA (cytosine1962-C5)-methyltransferase